MRAHHNRDVLGRSRGDTSHGVSTVGHDDVDLEAHQVCGESWQSVKPAIREAELQRNVLAFDVTESCSASRKASNGGPEAAAIGAGLRTPMRGTLGGGCAPTKSGMRSSINVTISRLAIISSALSAAPPPTLRVVRPTRAFTCGRASEREPAVRWNALLSVDLKLSDGTV